jgi:lipoprotein-anchoring transpeptidase ErfK/SrfK
MRIFCLLLGLFVWGIPAMNAQVIHRVKAGESLWLIAKRAGVSVAAIREANNLSSDVIWEGSDLIIPPPQARPSVPERTEERNPVPPLRPLPSELSPTPRGPLSERGLELLKLQVTLDRAGFSPGKIDGYDGKFTQLAKTLCETWNPAALRVNLPPTRTAQVPSLWKQYVNASLPGTGQLPDFKTLTARKQVILYYSALEFLAERFHCSESLLKKLNPQVNFENPSPGTVLTVPNVVPFEIEKYFNSKGEGVWSDLLGKGAPGRRVYISAPDSMLTLWEGEKLIRAYPITLNEEDSPRGEREIGSVTPGPTYMRKKTGLELLPGPNSPVGIVWCPLGNGFGIHGTSNPDSIGRSVSSGCVRLANWDAVRLAGMIRKGTAVFISERARKYEP